MRQWIDKTAPPPQGYFCVRSLIEVINKIYTHSCIADKPEASK